MVRSVVIIFVTWQENMAANHVLESSVKPFADSYLLSLCENNVDDVKGYGNHTVATAHVFPRILYVKRSRQS